MARKKKNDDVSIIHLFLAPFYILSIIIGVIINVFSSFINLFKKENKKAIEYSKEEKYNLEKAHLMKVRKSKKIKDSDVKWNLYQIDRAKALKERAYLDYAEITEQMGDILFNEKNYKGALQYYCEMAYLWVCCNGCNTGFLDKKTITKYHRKDIYTVRKLIDCGCECDYELENIKDVFMKFITIQVKFPLTREEAWQLIENDYNYFLNSVLDNLED